MPDPLSPATRSLLIEGTQLSHYRLIQKLGEGGMGAVYRAEDVRLGRHVALKLLPAVRARDVEARARFLAEARAVAALEHAHICTLFEFGEEGGQPFLAMQLVEGETLEHAIRRGPLSEGRVREILGAMSSALAAAHARGIIHRDVKSENVLLGQDGSIKLADFGIARLAESAGLTATNTVIGTPAYLSPEQVSGQRVTPASDQFSLSVVAYQALTGTLPFGGESLAAKLHAVMNEDPPPLASRRAGLAAAWESVVRRGLSKDPARRFETIQAFGSAVAATAASGAAPASEAPPAPAAGPPRTASTAARTASMVGATTRGGVTESGVRSLAVLPFENQSHDPDSDYFCSGITEDILTDLSRVPGLRVASRHAVERYAGKKVDIVRAASELGVEAILEGGVRRAGNRVRITARLVDGRDGFQMWAERYDRTLEDVFAVQEDISHAIATALRGAMTPTVVEAIRRVKPAEVEAYDLYLRGRELYRRYTPDDNREALGLFERAVEIDPEYALAWAGIADCCGQVVDKRWESDPAWLERGFVAARRAVEIEPRLAEGHKAEALLWRARRDSARSILSLRRALEADPRLVPAINNLGLEMLCIGDFAGAERALRHATHVDPAHAFPLVLLQIVLIVTRRYEEALEVADRVERVGASPFYSLYAAADRALTLALMGRREEALAALERGRAPGSSVALLDAAAAAVAVLTGDVPAARERLESLARRPFVEAYGCELAAGAAALIGDAAGAVAWLMRAEAIDPRYPAAWRIRPEFDLIRSSPEFTAFLGERGRRMVWPSEAPLPGEPERGRFESFEVASGVPEGGRLN